MRHHLWTIVVFTWLATPLFAQTQYDTSPGAQTGVQLFGSYFATDIDSVSNFNGNLHLSIPLFSLPEQFMDLYFLHELGHNFGADHEKPGFPTNAEYQKSIWENCFK
jgi:hypothetical protein